MLSRKFTALRRVATARSATRPRSGFSRGAEWGASRGPGYAGRGLEGPARVLPAKARAHPIAPARAQLRGEGGIAKQRHDLGRDLLRRAAHAQEIGWDRLEALSHQGRGH